MAKNKEKTEDIEPIRLETNSNRSNIKEDFEIVKSDITFKDVGGLHELKENMKIKIIYPFEKEELFKQYGKKGGGGLLLYGAPGCGKTFIAKACAGEIKEIIETELKGVIK